MGLMGVFVALLLPDFNRIIPELRVDKAATKLAADLRMAQQKAIGEMSDVLVYLEPADNRYYAWVIDRELNVNPLEDPLKGGAYLMVDYDLLDAFKGAVLAYTTPASGVVWFSPLGSLRFPGENLTITITHAISGYSRSVLVTYPLGKVSVQP